MSTWVGTGDFTKGLLVLQTFFMMEDLILKSVSSDGYEVYPGDHLVSYVMSYHRGVHLKLI